MTLLLFRRYEEHEETEILIHFLYGDTCDVSNNTGMSQTVSPLFYIPVM